MASILVTGAGGFIGSAVCRSLRRDGHAVAELSREAGDIAERATLENVGAVQHVFHLAGRTFVPDSWKDPLEFQRVNVLGTTNVLEFCRARGSRLTYISAYLYGVPETLPVSEACALRPNNPYALSKCLAEQVCAFYAKHNDVEVTVLRPFNVYGPGQKAHFLIPQILRDVKERKAVRVKDLDPRRDYVYIDDLVDALGKTLDGPRGYNVLNIGSGSSISVRELIAVVQAVARTELPVFSEGKVRPNEIDDVYADIHKARTLLGWSPSVTLRQGIERMMIEEAVA